MRFAAKKGVDGLKLGAHDPEPLIRSLIVALLRELEAPPDAVVPTLIRALDAWDYFNNVRTKDTEAPLRPDQVRDGS